MAAIPGRYIESLIPFASGSSYLGVDTGVYGPGNVTYSNGGTDVCDMDVEEGPYALPFLVHKTATFDRIGVGVDSAGVSGNILLSIYDTGTDGLPNSRLFTEVTIAWTTGTGEQLATISQELTPGLYWLAVGSSVASSSGQPGALDGYAPINLANGSILGRTQMDVTNNSAMALGVKLTTPATALPATWGASTFVNGNASDERAPGVGLRVA